MRHETVVLQLLAMCFMVLHESDMQHHLGIKCRIIRLLCDKNAEVAYMQGQLYYILNIKHKIFNTMYWSVLLQFNVVSEKIRLPYT